MGMGDLRVTRYNEGHWQTIQLEVNVSTLHSCWNQTSSLYSPGKVSLKPQVAMHDLGQCLQTASPSVLLWEDYKGDCKVATFILKSDIIFWFEGHIMGQLQWLCNYKWNCMTSRKWSKVKCLFNPIINVFLKIKTTIINIMIVYWPLIIILITIYYIVLFSTYCVSTTLGFYLQKSQTLIKKINPFTLGSP